MDFFNKFKKDTIKKIATMLKKDIVSVEISEVGLFQIVIVARISDHYFLHIVCEHISRTNYVEFIIKKDKIDVFYERYIAYPDGLFLDKKYDTDDKNIINFISDDLPIIQDVCSGKDLNISDIIIKRV